MKDLWQGIIIYPRSQEILDPVYSYHYMFHKTFLKAVFICVKRLKTLEALHKFRMLVNWLRNRKESLNIEKWGLTSFKSLHLRGRQYGLRHEIPRGLCATFLFVFSVFLAIARTIVTLRKTAANKILLQTKQERILCKSKN